MRERPLLLTNVAVMVAAVVIGWALLIGRDEPAGPGLGPAVQVRLRSTTTVGNSQTPPATGGPSTTGPPTAASTTTTPTPTGSTGSSAPTRATPSSGALTVPQHSPMPAGDDDDDDDDNDTDDDD